MRFQEMKAFPEGEPVIELSTSWGEVFDLHNFSEFRKFVYQPSELNFEFTYASANDVLATQRQRKFENHNIVLSFSPVADLIIEQHSDGERRNAETLSHITYNEGSAGWGLFQVYFMDGLEANFRARSVTLSTSPVSPDGRESKRPGKAAG